MLIDPALIYYLNNSIHGNLDDFKIPVYDLIENTIDPEFFVMCAKFLI